MIITNTEIMVLLVSFMNTFIYSYIFWKRKQYFFIAFLCVPAIFLLLGKISAMWGAEIVQGKMKPEYIFFFTANVILATMWINKFINIGKAGAQDRKYPEQNK